MYGSVPINLRTNISRRRALCASPEMKSQRNRHTSKLEQRNALRQNNILPMFVLLSGRTCSRLILLSLGHFRAIVRTGFKDKSGVVCWSTAKVPAPFLVCQAWSKATKIKYILARSKARRDGVARTHHAKQRQGGKVISKLLAHDTSGQRLSETKITRANSTKANNKGKYLFHQRIILVSLINQSVRVQCRCLKIHILRVRGGWGQTTLDSHSTRWLISSFDTPPGFRRSLLSTRVIP